VSPVRTFYATAAANHPLGCGYYEVRAMGRDDAHNAMRNTFGDEWSMLYESFDDVHELDRQKHGVVFSDGALVICGRP